MVTKRERRGEGYEIYILYIKEINSKDLLYSTGDYIQYREINKAKESEKEDIHMYN